MNRQWRKELQRRLYPAARRLVLNLPFCQSVGWHIVELSLLRRRVTPATALYFDLYPIAYPH
jgi:hypothetical protein